jgi:hypothetical protein
LSEAADRYQRTLRIPEHHRTPTQIAWLQGYDAGWTDAADRWLATPQTNDCGPLEDDTTSWHDEQEQDVA